jgi:hypothetical protein
MSAPAIAHTMLSFGFDEVMPRYAINAQAQAAEVGPDYSIRIRKGLGAPVAAQ